VLQWLTLLSPSTLPRSANLVHVRAPRTERRDPVLREPLARLAALDNAAGWQAATLALLVTQGSRREHAAWAEFAQDVPDAKQVFDDIALLPAARRQPWFEYFARALAPGPVLLRHEVIGAARRVMTADGLVSPLDQLRWVALRHLLAGSAVSAPAAAPTELEALDPDQARCVCVFSGFLSRLVPAPELTLDLTGYESVSQHWYDAVTAPWQDRLELPPRESHDVDAALRALRMLQSLPWLQRPVLVRSWYDAACALTDGPALHADAADALRLCCVLLDSPVPPELGRQYIEPDPAHH
jgi:hypothetical protein